MPALLADSAAFARVRRPMVSKLAANTPLREVVAGRLSQDGLPQQLAVRLAPAHPADLSMCVSHESIYRFVHVPSRTAVPTHVFHCLRTPDPPVGGAKKASTDAVGSAIWSACVLPASL